MTKKLGQVDQSGAEALIVSYLCRNGRFRQLFTNKIKVHTYVAAHLFKNIWQQRGFNIDKILNTSIPELPKLSEWKELSVLIKSTDDWAENERYYYLAKQTCHSANYDIKAPTFQINLLEKSKGAINLDIKTCKSFLGLYHDLFLEIREWHQDIQVELRKTRVLKNLFGDARRFSGPWGDRLFKAAYAFIPQSTVGVITHEAIADLFDILYSGCYRSIELDILQNGHDSILFQFNPKYEKEACTLVANALARDLASPKGEKFRMGVECSTGYNWAPKSDKNPEGLEEYKL